MSRALKNDSVVYKHHDFEVRCHFPVGLVPLNDEGHCAIGVHRVAPDGDGLRRTAVAEILGVAKYRSADSRHLDRVPRGLIATGVTVARRSEEDDALLLDRLHRIGDDTRLVERFMEIDDVVADDAKPALARARIPLAKSCSVGLAVWKSRLAPGARSCTICIIARPSSVPPGRSCSTTTCEAGGSAPP